MENAAPTPPKAPRGWLWLARGAVLFFGLACLLLALALLESFLEKFSGQWHAPANLVGLAACIIVLFCGVFPYSRVMWKLRRGSIRGNGLTEALTIGAFWFFFEFIFLSDASFHGLSVAAESGVAENSAELLQMALGMGILVSVPGFLLILSGMKLGGTGSPAPDASGTPAGAHLGRVRGSVGVALALVLLPAALCPFTLRRDLSVLQFVIIEALILAQAVPYALVLRGLNNTARKFEMPKMASGVAAGFLTLLVLCGIFYGIIVADTPSSRPHQTSTWAELVFVALLALANLTVLWAGRRSMRASEPEEGKKRFAWGTLAVPLCLLVFAFFVIAAFVST